VQATYPDNFRVDYALSREQTNTKGGKMYIQDKMEEYADEIFGLLDQVRSAMPTYATDSPCTTNQNFDELKLCVTDRLSTPKIGWVRTTQP